jgi:hypothetical protein
MIASCSLGFRRMNNSTGKTKLKIKKIAKHDKLERPEGRDEQAFQAWTVLPVRCSFDHKGPDEHAMNEVGDLGAHFFSSHRMISKDQSKGREASTPFITALKKTLGQTKAMTRNQEGGRNEAKRKKT